MPDALEATVAALEELRRADAILTALSTPEALANVYPRGWLRYFVGMDFTYARSEVARADEHLRRAIVLTEGSQWLHGAADDGSRLPLDTTVGLRFAVRQYFDRLRASDARLPARVAPLDASK